VRVRTKVNAHLFNADPATAPLVTHAAQLAYNQITHLLYSACRSTTPHIFSLLSTIITIIIIIIIMILLLLSFVRVTIHIHWF
jgi:hypothetical protein